MDAVLVKNLIGRREGTRLDFKQQMYDWSKNGNIELAKDLMAFANALQRGSANAYILIGVKEKDDKTGELIGIPAASHLDDAAMRQKVSAHLNRVPDFTYAPVDVDGFSIGVFEIRPGGRPYFAAKDAPPLRKNICTVRDGSTCGDASPIMISEWAREDEPIEVELRSLQLEKERAQMMPHPLLRKRAATLSSGSYSQIFSLENAGVTPFDWVGGKCLWQIKTNAPVANVADMEPYAVDVYANGEPLVQPGGSISITTVVNDGELKKHLQSFIGKAAPLPEGWLQLFEAILTVTCRNLYGRSGEASIQFKY